jgi:hypothetical protein
MPIPIAGTAPPSPAVMGEENHAEVWASYRDPAAVHGICEDYRAGLHSDRAHEEADRAAGTRRTRQDPRRLPGAVTPHNQSSNAG